MKYLLATAAALALGIAGANAQTADPAAPQAGAAPTPTCAQALPQVQALAQQVEGDGHDVSGAAPHLAQAEQAQAGGDEQACINALIEAQDEVLRVAQLGTQQPSMQ